MSPSEVHALWKEVSASSGIEDGKTATTTNSTTTSVSSSSVVGSHNRPIMNGVPHHTTHPEGALMHPAGFLVAPHGIL